MIKGNHTKHLTNESSPRPWRAVKDANGGDMVLDASGLVVAMCVTEKDALMIAAAGEAIDALEILEYSHDAAAQEQFFTAMRLVLKKARGQ